MIWLSRPCHFNFFKGCLPQISLGRFLNAFSQMKFYQAMPKKTNTTLLKRKRAKKVQIYQS